MQIKKATLHFMLLKLFDNFKQVVKPTSKSPAIINIIQFIIMCFGKVKAHYLAGILQMLKNELFY